jgi:hypothetical protein
VQKHRGDEIVSHLSTHPTQSSLHTRPSSRYTQGPVVATHIRQASRSVLDALAEWSVGLDPGGEGVGDVEIRRNA